MPYSSRWHCKVNDQQLVTKDADMTDADLSLLCQSHNQHQKRTDTNLGHRLHVDLYLQNPATFPWFYARTVR